MFPLRRKSNTTTGTSCSMHIVSAVRSITASCRSIACENVSRSKRVAFGSFFGSAV